MPSILIVSCEMSGVGLLEICGEGDETNRLIIVLALPSLSIYVSPS